MKRGVVTAAFLIAAVSLAACAGGPQAAEPTVARTEAAAQPTAEGPGFLRQMFLGNLGKRQEPRR